MRKLYIQAGLLALIAVLALFQGYDLIVENRKVFGATLAGAYVMALGGILALLTLLYATTSLGAAKAQTDALSCETTDKKNARNLQYLLSLLVLYIVSVDFLGYGLSSILFFIIYLRFIGRLEWKPLLVIAIGFGVAFTLVFRLVGMSLPRGFIPFF